MQNLLVAQDLDSQRRQEQRAWLRAVRRSGSEDGLGQLEFAEAVGVSRSLVANWETGTPMSRAHILRIMELFESAPLPPASIVDEVIPPQVRSRDIFKGDLRPKASGKIKVYGAVSAGNGNTSTYDPHTMEVPIEFARDDYGALVVSGDSMNEVLEHGDICIFADSRDLKKNTIVAASLSDGDWVTKRLVLENGQWLLRSDNKKYSDIAEDFQVHGFLVGLVRDDGPERLIRLNPYGLKL